MDGLSLNSLSSALALPSLARRAAFALLFALLTAALWMTLRGGLEDTTPYTTTEQAITGALRKTASLQADPTQLVLFQDPAKRPWTGTLGYVGGFALARPIKAEESGETDDLYYFEARIDADGKPIDIRRLSNLTSTPFARERLLVRSDRHALFQVEVFGQVQSLLMVDFTRDEREPAEALSTLDQVRLSITHLQDAGRSDGIGQHFYKIDPPTLNIKATVLDGAFNIQLGRNSGQTIGSAATGDPLKVGGSKSNIQFMIDPASGKIMPVKGAVTERITYQPRYFAQKTFVPWLVDTVRNHPLVGVRKIAMLERYVFYWKDRAKQKAFALGLLSDDEPLSDEFAVSSKEGDSAQPASSFSISVLERTASKHWPPPPLKPLLDEPKEGEGIWLPVDISWLRKHPDAPPAFVRTVLRTDRKRKYTNTILIAMDMRQLDLNMVAGTRSPESGFGTRGTGLIPRRPEVFNNVVAAFNGGFKTAHGAFGMQVDHDTILPAMPFTATAAVEDSGKVRLGSWNNSMDVPKEIRSFRQNLPPLVADGKLNPTGKRKWGGTANELDGIHTTRSGLCMKAPSTLFYVWSQDASADAIGRAMIAAGCEFGMHLDMNPTHTGWAFYRANANKLNSKSRIKDFNVQPGSKSMKFREGRYINRDVKDFFYLTLRQTMTSALPKPPQGFAKWSSKGAPYGSEGFLPIASSAPHDERTSSLVAFKLPHIKARLRLGDREPDPTGTREIPEEDRLELADPVALIDLGLIDQKSPSGLFSLSSSISPPQDNDAALVIRKDGSLSILPPNKARSVRPGGPYAALRGGPSLLAQGAVSPQAADVRAPLVAFGTSKDNTLFVLHLQTGHGADAAQTLKELGVRNALALPTPSKTTPLRFLSQDPKTKSLQELHPTQLASSPLDTTRGHTTHLYLERLPNTEVRVERLRLEDVELSEEDARRQRRLRVQINAMRQELRSVENNKYKEHVEKKAEGN